MSSNICFTDLSGTIIQARSVKLATFNSYCLVADLTYEEFSKVAESQAFAYERSLCTFSPKLKISKKTPIQVKLTLEPTLQMSVKDAKITPTNFIEELYKLYQNTPEHLIFHTESWILLSVKENWCSDTTEHQTIWNYFDWSELASDDLGEDKFQSFLADNIAKFIQESSNYQYDISSQSQIENLLRVLLPAVPSLASKNSTDSSQALANNLTELVTKTFESNLYRELSCAVTELKQNSAKTNSHLEYKSTLMSLAIEYFQQQNWKFKKIPDNPVLYTQFKSNSGAYKCYLYVQEEECQMTFYSTLEECTPSDKLDVMSKLICNLNNSLPIGNFQLNFSTGEVSCKTYVQLKNRFAAPAFLFDSLIKSNIAIMDEVKPEIYAVIDGDYK
ncbi:hypothetical protein IQ255_11405 [Pleurocapsales cyanobacterium LEGE 10410]|nr:hypothetical protein [Pleurocapsales cyanobacterium LEGE 10410]